MIVLDVETTGTDSRKHSILSIGAVNFEHPEKQFYDVCRIWEGAHVEPVALAINGMSQMEITDQNRKPESDLVKIFFDWLERQEDMVIAGQNVFFDTDFLKDASARAGITSPLSKRIIDLHSLTYAHMVRRGIMPPILNRKTNIDSDKIMAYVGIPAEPKPHIALNGAIWEAEAFSRILYDKGLLSQFSEYPIPWIS
jgi:DNA polymerase III epsilon subunit-like protein